MAASSSKLSLPAAYRIICGWHIIIHAVMLMTLSHCGRNFTKPELCNDKIKTDCSYQIPEVSDGSCVVIPTSECKTYSLSLVQWPPLQPISQEDTSFSVLIKPYVFGNVLAISALDLKVTTNSSDISGFVLLVESIELNISYNSCRIFDFEKARKIYKGQVSLSYDCYINLLSKTDNYYITFRSIPQNVQLKYIVTIPRVDNIEVVTNLCQWKSFMIIYVGGLSQGKVEIKFTPASSNFNVSHYNLSLVNITSKKLNVLLKKYVVNTPHKSMLQASFEDVPTGNYAVFLSPVNGSRSVNCSITKSYSFHVNNISGDNTLTTAVIVAATVVAAIIFIIVASLYIIFRPAVIQVRPKILIVYSYDCKEHKDCVSNFASYLKKWCYIDVFIDMHEVGNKNADTWYIRKIEQASAAVIVISRGVFHKCQDGNSPPMKEGLPWRNTFSVAKTLLLREGLRGNKKIVKVYFKYSGAHDIPSDLKSLGETFQLMNDFNKFLCHIHNKSRNNFLHIYPRMPGSDMLSKHDGTKLNEAIEDMVNFQAHNPDWFNQALDDSS